MVRRTRPGISRFRVRCSASPRNENGRRSYPDTPPHFPRRFAPESCMTFPSKTEGAGNAGCPPHPQPRVQNKKAHERSHHRSTGFTQHSLRNGFNGLLRALLGDRAFLPPSPAENSANLTPASGCQDHTTSPSAATSFVEARLRAPDAAASIASRSQRS
jgi:hypothetical protein